MEQPKVLTMMIPINVNEEKLDIPARTFGWASFMY